jgi:hypothetical protein
MAKLLPPLLRLVLLHPTNVFESFIVFSLCFPLFPVCGSYVRLSTRADNKTERGEGSVRTPALLATPWTLWKACKNKSGLFHTLRWREGKKNFIWTNRFVSKRMPALSMAFIWYVDYEAANNPAMSRFSVKDPWKCLLSRGTIYQSFNEHVSLHPIHKHPHYT